MGRKARAELRRDIRKVLANLDDRWVRAASTEICLKLAGFLAESDNARIDRVLAWSAFFPGEIDLSALILEELKKRRVFLPRSDDQGKMTFIELGDGWQGDLEPGLFGIPEPKLGSGAVFEAGSASRTVVLVPGLAFDRVGGRLGRGAGFYDRFLSKNDLFGAIKVGVGLSLQFVDAVPTEDHDVDMDWLCSERGVFKAERS